MECIRHLFRSQSHAFQIPHTDRGHHSIRTGSTFYVTHSVRDVW